MNDQSRPVATHDDKGHTLTIEQAADRYAQAGHSRTVRALQRYCKTGTLDCVKTQTKLGDMYLVAPYSVERHITQINEIIATTERANGREQPRTFANSDAEKNKVTKDVGSADRSRTVATETSDSSPYVAQLENENLFLRGQVAVKDTQIASLLERDKETNTLIHRLQAMLAPLLTAPAERHEAPIHKPLSETPSEQA